MNEIFVSFPFDERFDAMFKSIRDTASQHQLNAVRIDQSSKLAKLIPEEINRSIRESRLVIADLTGNNPNVLHEVGLAQAFGKPLVLISQEEPTKAPFNIRPYRFIRYKHDDLEGLQRHIDGAITEVTSLNEILRAMLVPSTLGHPTRESWFVIAASPLSFRRLTGRKGGYEKIRRTSSDYVGVRGILQSFGMLFGFDALPDNIDPEDYDDKVLHEPMNIYCIASPKANHWTSILLEEFNRRWIPSLEFRADPSSKNLRNPRVSILTDEIMMCPSGWKLNTEGDRYESDFGIIVRGPNPNHEDYMVAIIAGRSSLGTEAACTAFTDAIEIKKIKKLLEGHKIDLENHKQPFWVLVSMKRKLGDQKEEAIRDTLKIERVDAFHRR